MADVHRKFAERRNRTKTAIVGDLEAYYADQDEWNECAGDLLDYAVFYSQACSQWLKAILLFGYDNESYGEQFLVPGCTQIVNDEELDVDGLNVLEDYWTDRSLVTLLLNGCVAKADLERASHYYYACLKKDGYADEAQILRDRVKPEVYLSVFMPQFIRNALLGVDYSVVVGKIAPSLKSKEKIWMYAWRFRFRTVRVSTLIVVLLFCFPNLAEERGTQNERLRELDRHAK